MTLLRILSPRSRGILPNRRPPVMGRLAAQPSRPAAPDLVEVRIARAIRQHAALRRAV